MKLLVKTTGDFMFADPSTRCEIAWNRPSVCQPSNFIQSHMAQGRLKLLSNELSDEATDAEFAQFLTEASGDSDLAVAAFIAKFGPQKGDEEVVDEAALAAAAAAAAAAASTVKAPVAKK